MVKIINVEKIASSLGLEKILTFRPLGKKAKEMILKEIDLLNPGDSLNIDFNNIELSDVSFVDEMIIEVQLYTKRKDNIIIFISNVKLGIFENLEAALALKEQKNRVKIQVLNRLESGYSFVGALEQNLQATFKMLTQRKYISAREIAETYGLEINSASNRLKKLYDAGLVLRKEIIDENGRQHIYYLPD